VLFRLLEVLNKCPDESFAAEIEKVLDVDQVLRYFAVSVIIVHLDNYIGLCHNFYLYEMDGRFTILPWDLNMAFGGFNMGMMGGDAGDYRIDDLTNLTDRPLAGRLLAHGPYLERYHAYLDQMLNGYFATGAMEARIDALAAMIRPYVEADPTKSFTMEDFEKGLTEGVARGGMMGGPGMWGPPGMGPGGGEARPDAAGAPQPPDANAAGVAAADAQRQPTGPVPGPDAGGRAGGFGRRGPGGGGGPGGPGGGPGLKSFAARRRVSVRGQLDGELPSKSQTQGFGGMPFGPMGPGMGGPR